MNPQIVITGTGLITPLGASVEQTWSALQRGEFIRDHARSEGFQPVTYLSRATQLAQIAAKESIQAARWTSEHLNDDATALVIGTSKGPIVDWIAAPPGVAYRTNDVSKYSIGLHEIASSVAHEFGFGHGPRQTFSGACASGLHALIHAAMLIQSGRANRALVVAAEASVHPLFVGSFRRLGVLPPEGFGCRPFDLNRRGFLMSEAAAAVCLERADSDAPCLAKLDRYALGADATHLTGVDPSGVTMRRLLDHVIDRRPVDLIHAHGTGTTMNDPIELAAIEDSLSDQDTPGYLYSHKGALGHSLGAAGLVAVVLNVESHRRGMVLPNVQTRNPMPTKGIHLIREAAARLSSPRSSGPIRRSVAIAAGFGGAVAVVSCISA